MVDPQQQPPVQEWRTRRLGPALAGALALAGLGLRAWLAARTTFPGFDEVYYLEQARSLVSSGVLPFGSFPPGWPLLVSLPLWLLDVADPLAPLRAAQLLNVPLGALLIWLTWLVLRRRAGDGVALMAAAVIALQPLVIRLATGAMSDLLGACCLAAAWLLLERGRRLAAGLVLGYGYVVRPEIMIVAAAVAAHHALRERRVPWRLLLGTAACALPYLLFARRALGHWSLSGKSGFFTAAMAEAQQRGLGEILAENVPALLAGLPRLLGWPLVLLALVAAVRRPGRWLLFLLPLAVIPVFPFRMDPRYWVPYLPFVLLGAAAGVGWLRTLVPGAQRRQLVVAVAVFAVAGFGLVNGRALLDVDEEHEVYIGLRDTGLWLRERVDHDTIVAAYKPYTSYWAWCRFANYGLAVDARDVVDSSIARGASYIVVNRYIAEFLMPELRPLTRPLPPELAARIVAVKVFEYPELPGHDTIVLRVREPVPAAPNPWHVFWVP